MILILLIIDFQFFNHAPGSFVPCAKIAGGRSYSIVSDYIGRPTNVFDEDGECVWQAEFDIYGRIRNLKGDKFFVPFRQLGQYEDEELGGLYYNRFRYYDSESGGYISKDPIGLAGNNPNEYAYVYDTNIQDDLLGLNLVTHLFHGEINRRGNAVGFHHEGSIGHIGKARVSAITVAPDAQGLYKAKVEVFDSRTVSWVTKGPESTFFPKQMSRADVLKNIDEAFARKTMTGAKWEGVSDSGIKIGGYVDAHGNIATAFPLIQYP